MSRRRFLPPLLWAAIILALTSIPIPGSVAVPGGDKTAHLVMYAVLGYLSTRALRPPFSPTTLLGVILAIAAFAALDEAHQLLIPGRFADRLDWYADIVGASMGCVLAVLQSRAQEGSQ